MMKWMFVLLVFLSLQPLSAAQQYSTYQCDNLRDRIEFTRKRISSGNDIVASSASNISDRALVKEYSTYCQSPVDTVRVVRGAITPSVEHQHTSTQAIPSFSANNAIFTGEKANQWANFYQPPRQCRQKELTDTEFVFCAEHKAEQRAQFELIWQSRFSKTSVQIVHSPASMSAQPQKTMQLAVMPTPNDTKFSADELDQSSYWRALDEQNQNFKWYGIIMLVLMVLAGVFVWRR